MFCHMLTPNLGVSVLVQFGEYIRQVSRTSLKVKNYVKNIVFYLWKRKFSDVSVPFTGRYDCGQDGQSKL